MISNIPYDVVLMILNNVYEELPPLDKMRFNCPKSHCNTQFKKPTQFDIAREKLSIHIKEDKLWTNQAKPSLSKSRDLYQLKTSYFDDDYDVYANYNEITAMILAKSVPTSIEHVLFDDWMHSYGGHDDSESYLKCYSPYDRQRKYDFMLEEGNRRLIVA